jgi:3-hydroxyisobutyrate dehydrogenase-like beta-hydroxyacid dehydrogenase
MRGVSWDEISAADQFLSIVPPGSALDLAREAAAHWKDAPRRPLYVDCNAVSPQTVEEIASVVATGGGAFVDAGIIGGPPRPGDKGPRIYASGAEAPMFARLTSFGLDVKVLSGAMGAASALKMSYAGITKGVTALSAIIILGAVRAGAADALKAELAASLPAHFTWLSRQIPGMIPKAYRWVAEMNEIATFQQDDPAGSEIFEAIARFYTRIAADESGEGQEISALREFVA